MTDMKQIASSFASIREVPGYLARHSGVRRSAKNIVGAGQSTQWDEIFFDLEV